MTYTPNYDLYGPTVDRPLALKLPVGAEYFDTDFEWPVFWNGVEWVEFVPLAPQEAYVSFENINYFADTNQPPPTLISILVTTGDNEPLAEDLTVSVNPTGVGTAIEDTHYTDNSPYVVVIPAGTPHLGTVTIPFAHIQFAPPGLVTHELEIISAVSNGPAMIGAVDVQNTTIVNIDAAGA